MSRIIFSLKNSAYSFGGFLKLSLLSVLMGGIAGAAGTLFHHTLSFAVSLREAYPILLLFLPVSGLLIAFIYRHPNNGAAGTNLVIMAANEKAELPGKMAPMIFVGTILTQLCGGSAGREGAALQLGGSIGGATGRLLRLDRSSRSILVMCGMSACFSALFGTPLAAAVFVLELECIGIIRYTAFLPCVFSSVTASAVAGFFHIDAEHFSIPDTAADIPILLRVILLSAICSVVSAAFCMSFRGGHRVASRVFKNPYIRIACGGVLVVGIAYLTGYFGCLGAGMNIVSDSVEGSVPVFTFPLKFLLTVITVSSGFRGGEIVPTFAIGASLGCILGPFIGLDSSFSSGIAMISLFCGVTNCPIASVLLAAELFDFTSPVPFATAVAVSYVLSGNFSLYATQSILFSKTSPSKGISISDITDISSD